MQMRKEQNNMQNNRKYQKETVEQKIKEKMGKLCQIKKKLVSKKEVKEFNQRKKTEETN